MKTSIYIIVLLSFVLVFGCGKKSDTTKKDGEKTEQTQKTEEKKDNTSGSDQKSEKSGLSDLGLTEGLPSNYPKDIPQPPNSKCMGSLNSSEGTVVTFESSDKAKPIIDFYKEEMKKLGFSLGEGGELLVTDEGGLMGWKKDNREIGLMLGYDKEKGKTSVVLTYK
ncbi:MAG: hypothetical protein NTV87_09755 [Ignavibacteriae bacterium]|nr:hypothetical protein [Ignavibacteriota bacterium]